MHRVWHDTAIPFTDVLPAFEMWLENHGLCDLTSNAETLKTAAFVTWFGSIRPLLLFKIFVVNMFVPHLYICTPVSSFLDIHIIARVKLPCLTVLFYLYCGSGNWDIKTKIPEQCITSEIDMPAYFNEWINLKDIYFNFYKFRVMIPNHGGNTSTTSII